MPALASTLRNRLYPQAQQYCTLIYHRIITRPYMTSTKASESGLIILRTHETLWNYDADVGWF